MTQFAFDCFSVTTTVTVTAEQPNRVIVLYESGGDAHVAWVDYEELRRVLVFHEEGGICLHRIWGGGVELDLTKKADHDLAWKLYRALKAKTEAEWDPY